LKKKQNSEVVLIPQPSNDVNDPLNWPKWKKGVALTTVLVFSIISSWLIIAAGNGIVLLIKEFHKSAIETSQGVITWCIFTLGIGVNFYCFMDLV
jgi:hypothetical protein